jgi:type IV secretory pathway VirB10-like protein
MSSKKRKPLGSAMEEFVFGTKEKEAASPAPPFVILPAPTPTASLTPETALPATPPPEAALPTVTPPQPPVSAPEPVSIQSKELSLMSKLQAPDKEATVRFTVDMSETLHRKLSMLAAKTGRKKVDIVRMLLEEGLKEVEG